MKKFIFSLMVLVFAFKATNSTALAQRETGTGVEVETDVILLRRDLRADKKQLIALNLSLTETEATKFWPVYDQYAAEMAKYNDEFYMLIRNYAANQKTLTDAEAGQHDQALGGHSDPAFTDATKIYSCCRKGHSGQKGSTVFPDRSAHLCSDGFAGFIKASVAPPVGLIRMLREGDVL